MFCTWVLFLSLGDTLGRDVFTMQCSGFVGEDGVGGLGPMERNGFNHPNSSPVLTSSTQHGSPSVDSQKHQITL